MLQVRADREGQSQRACMRYAWQLGLAAHDLLLIDCCRSRWQTVLIRLSISTRSAASGSQIWHPRISAFPELKRVPLSNMTGIIRNIGLNLPSSSKKVGLLHCVVVGLELPASSFSLG